MGLDNGGPRSHEERYLFEDRWIKWYLKWTGFGQIFFRGRHRDLFTKIHVALMIVQTWTMLQQMFGVYDSLRGGRTSNYNYLLYMSYGFNIFFIVMGNWTLLNDNGIRELFDIFDPDFLENSVGNQKFRILSNYAKKGHFLIVLFSIFSGWTVLQTAYISPLIRLILRFMLNETQVIKFVLRPMWYPFDVTSSPTMFYILPYEWLVIHHTGIFIPFFVGLNSYFFIMTSAQFHVLGTSIRKLTNKKVKIYTRYTSGNRQWCSQTSERCKVLKNSGTSDSKKMEDEQLLKALYAHIEDYNKLFCFSTKLINHFQTSFRMQLIPPGVILGSMILRSVIELRIGPGGLAGVIGSLSFLVYASTILIYYFITCYSANGLYYVNDLVRDALYDTKWSSKSTKFQKNILSFMIRCNKPIEIKIFTTVLNLNSYKNIFVRLYQFIMFLLETYQPL